MLATQPGICQEEGQDWRADQLLADRQQSLATQLENGWACRGTGVQQVLLRDFQGLSSLPDSSQVNYC